MALSKITARLNKKRILELENKLIRGGYDFKVKQTNYSIAYKTDKNTFVFSSGFIGLGALKIMSMVKSDIKKNLDSNNFDLKKVNPVYYDYNIKNFDAGFNSFYNCTELDINKAYLTSAYYQKIISEKVYNRLLEVSREMRLRALGAIASQKTVTQYQAGKIIEVYQEQDDNLRQVWNMICAGVSELMSDLIRVQLKNEFIFFWVDNLFVNHKRIIDSSLVKIKYPVKIDYSRQRYSLNILVDNKRNFTLPLQTKRSKLE